MNEIDVYFYPPDNLYTVSVDEFNETFNETTCQSQATEYVRNLPHPDLIETIKVFVHSQEMSKTSLKAGNIIYFIFDSKDNSNFSFSHAFVSDMDVVPRFRRMGVGRALFMTAFSRYNNINDWLRYIDAAAQTEVEIFFYLSLGFQPYMKLKKGAIILRMTNFRETFANLIKNRGRIPTDKRFSAETALRLWRGNDLKSVLPSETTLEEAITDGEFSSDDMWSGELPLVIERNVRLDGTWTSTWKIRERMTNKDDLMIYFYKPDNFRVLTNEMHNAEKCKSSEIEYRNKLPSAVSKVQYQVYLQDTKAPSREVHLAGYISCSKYYMDVDDDDGGDSADDSIDRSAIYIDDLVVVAKFRRMGVGRAMFMKLFSEFNTIDRWPSYIDAHAWNKEAILFFLSLRFQPYMKCKEGAIILRIADFRQTFATLIEYQGKIPLRDKVPDAEWMQLWQGPIHVISSSSIPDFTHTNEHMRNKMENNGFTYDLLWKESRRLLFYTQRKGPSANCERKGKRTRKILTLDPPHFLTFTDPASPTTYMSHDAEPDFNKLNDTGDPSCTNSMRIWLVMPEDDEYLPAGIICIKSRDFQSGSKTMLIENMKVYHRLTRQGVGYVLVSGLLCRMAMQTKDKRPQTVMGYVIFPFDDNGNRDFSAILFWASLGFQVVKPFNGTVVMMIPDFDATVYHLATRGKFTQLYINEQKENVISFFTSSDHIIPLRKSTEVDITDFNLQIHNWELELFKNK